MRGEAGVRMKRNVFIVVLLLVVAAAAALSLWLFFHRDGGPDEPAPPPVMTPELTAPPERTPEPAPAVETPEPEPSETPAPTPALQLAETPEPTPAPTPRPAGVSGSFASDTGTALNLLADWTVYTDAEGNRKMEVALSATHYALRTDESKYGLSLTVDGRSYSADCPAIEYDGGETAVTPLHTFMLDAPSGSAEIEAVWHFKGSYSGKELEQITASGTAGIR